MIRSLKFLAGVGQRILLVNRLSSKYILSEGSKVIGFHTSRQLNVKITSNPLLQKLNGKASLSKFVKDEEKPFEDMTMGEKIKETRKDFASVVVCLIGAGITGVFFYVIGKELISDQSPNGLYNKAHKYCLKDQKVIDNLGTPITSYTDRSRGARRSHLRFYEYLEDGVKVMRVSFYLDGPYNKGKVWAESRQNTQGKYEMTQIVLKLREYPYDEITIMNQRNQLDDLISIE